MNNFDKIFSEKLQNEQAFDFREDDWQEVSDRLDMHAPTAVWTWKKALVPIMLASLVGVIGFLWLKLDRTSGELDQLKKDLFENPQIQRDTVIQTVVLRDTIFAAASQNSNINTHDISWVGKPVSGVVNPFLSLGDNLAKKINQPLTSANFLQNLTEKSPYQFGVMGQSNDDLASFERIQNLPDNVPGLALTGVNYETELWRLRTKNAPIVSNPHFQLLGAKFGVAVGKSFIPDGKLTAVASSNIGVRAEFLFIKNLSLTAGLAFHNLSYETRPNFVGGELPLPEDSYNPADLIFAQSDQNFTQLKLGFKYTFGKDLNIKPYVGLNYLATANFRKEFYYLYDPTIYAVPEYEASFKSTDVTANGFGIDLGVEYEAKDWLSIQFETYYHNSNRKPGSLYHNLLGVRTGAMIKF